MLRLGWERNFAMTYSSIDINEIIGMACSDKVSFDIIK